MARKEMAMASDKQRKDLLANMCSKRRDKVLDKVIPFQNNDVPTFLSKLDRFEAESKKSRLVIG